TAHSISLSIDFLSNENREFKFIQVIIAPQPAKNGKSRICLWGIKQDENTLTDAAMCIRHWIEASTNRAVSGVTGRI
ncbi:MAG: hypothetical protein LBQ10_09605, partial [Desulfovibrio sp.]|nr:hypothetical protein [Desulfovibrio sp.]